MGRESGETECILQNVFEFYLYFSVLRFAGIEFQNSKMKTQTKTVMLATAVVNVRACNANAFKRNSSSNWHMYQVQNYTKYHQMA